MKNVKLSIFNYKLELNDEVIIFNTYTGSIVKFSMEEYGKLENFDLLPYEMELLQSLGIIVTDEINEFDRVKFNLMRASFGDKTASFRIFTTNDCNARCFYCFEKNKNSDMLNVKTMDSIIKFIKKEAVNSNEIRISWFGGEPLLNVDIIDYYYRTVKKDPFFGGKMISYSLITNGSLITDSLADKIANVWRINNVQISMDGDRDEHNARKQYVDIEDGYQNSLNAVKYLLGNGVKVAVRVNYDKNNINKLEKLFEELSNIKKQYRQLAVYSYPLFDFCGNEEYQFSQEEIGQAESFLHDRMYSNEIFKYNVPKLKMSNCFATLTKGFVIDPSGNIYKCSSHIGESDYIIGNVNSKSYELTKAYTDWLPLNINEKCKNCNLFPICLGGCKAKELNNNNEFCPVIKYTIDDILKNYIELGGAL